MSASTSIVEILWRYKKREELSAEEIAELKSWLRESPGHEQLFEDLSNLVKWEKELKGWKDRNPDPTWEKIRRRVEAMSPDTFKEKSRLRWILVITVAAASVLIIAGIFWRLNIRKTATRPPVSRLTASEILPASSTATLTLGDGSVIQLDSMRAGTIAKQGNTNITKTDSTALNYQSSGTNTGEADFNTLSTPRGSQYNLLLPDGSKVWLNAMSTLRFPVSFAGTLRKVELNGEAYFEVASNKSKPFIVQTGRSMSIRVLGTHFNVSAYPDEPVAKAELLEGSILAFAGRDSALIKPGQQVRMNEKEQLEIKPANIEQATAWKNKIFWYNNASFDEIMRQLSRWYDMDIIYKGQVNQSYTGILPTSLPLSNVLKILEKGGNVHFTIGKENQVTVSP